MAPYVLCSLALLAFSAVGAQAQTKQVAAAHSRVCMAAHHMDHTCL